MIVNVDVMTHQKSRKDVRMDWQLTTFILLFQLFVEIHGLIIYNVLLFSPSTCTPDANKGMLNALN